MSGDIDMQNPPGTNLHRREDVEDTEGRGYGNKEIAGDDGLRMVVNKSPQR